MDNLKWKWGCKMLKLAEIWQKTIRPAVIQGREGLYPAFSHGIHRLNTLRKFLLVRGVEHAEVAEKVYEDAGFTGRYAFMATLSCGIAVLGLLQSSPAVVIGAMLISPLMGPIVGLGFSLAIFDWHEFRRSAIALVIGSAMAVAFAMLIVGLSPLTDATREIVARTRPTLFDLLVAVFSGLAGGYATIKGRGGAIVGVAIATALMPPLAVVGWGLAEGSWAAASGAGMLFLTNLVAIALTVTILARLYGFGADVGHDANMYQTGIVLVAFIGLAIPLGLSLRTIAIETWSNNQFEAVLDTTLGDNAALIESASVGVERDGSVTGRATAFVRAYDSDAQSKVQTALETALDRPATVDLNQIEVAENTFLERDAMRRQLERVERERDGVTASAQASAARAASEQRLVADLRQGAPFAVTAVDIDPAARTVRYVAAPDPAFPISALRVSETALREHYTEWAIEVIPPPTGLAPIPFAQGGAVLPDPPPVELEDALWAIERWGKPKMVLTGLSSLGGSTAFNATLARERAETVAAVLNASGIETVVVTGFPAPGQAQAQRREGALAFQRVDITLASDQTGPDQTGPDQTGPAPR